ncbi:hypothetical protein Purlil1_350 [Purpureocillium lilacinum]|uniref:Uncharacterized protein n=1 Tax=Purpureocillium lilacinum TaxID=33203 RepID=A0ABR0CGX4_PURLI|nr:hypothetical protein Purlil1_350 [Purpureocillium lilacinum]
MALLETNARRPRKFVPITPTNKEEPPILEVPVQFSHCSLGWTRGFIASSRRQNQACLVGGAVRSGAFLSRRTPPSSSDTQRAHTGVSCDGRRNGLNTCSIRKTGKRAPPNEMRLLLINSSSGSLLCAPPKRPAALRGTNSSRNSKEQCVGDAKISRYLVAQLSRGNLAAQRVRETHEICPNVAHLLLLLHGGTAAAVGLLRRVRILVPRDPAPDRRHHVVFCLVANSDTAVGITRAPSTLGKQYLMAATLTGTRSLLSSSCWRRLWLSMRFSCSGALASLDNGTLRYGVPLRFAAGLVSGMAGGRGSGQLDALSVQTSFNGGRQAFRDRAQRSLHSPSSRGVPVVGAAQPDGGEKAAVGGRGAAELFRWSSTAGGDGGMYFLVSYFAHVSHVIDARGWRM